MTELDRRLLDLGESLEVPATPPLAEQVGVELRAGGSSSLPLRRGAGVPTIRFALLGLLAALLLAAGAAAAVPATRHAVLEFLGLRGETVERVPRLPENLRAKPAWRLGRPTTLAAAHAQLAFEALLPAAVDGPNGVFVNRGVPGNSLNLTYAPQAGLPRSRFTGVGLLVDELSGHAGPGFYGKMIPRDARVERFGIDGHFAVWIEGLHAFFYKPSSDNTFHIGHARLAADTLIVQRGDVMVRLEGHFDKARAIEVARSLHR